MSMYHVLHGANMVHMVHICCVSEEKIDNIYYVRHIWYAYSLIQHFCIIQEKIDLIQIGRVKLVEKGCNPNIEFCDGLIFQIKIKSTQLL